MLFQNRYGSLAPVTERGSLEIMKKHNCTIYVCNIRSTNRIEIQFMTEIETK